MGNKRTENTKRVNMANKQASNGGKRIDAVRHKDKRKNIPSREGDIHLGRRSALGAKRNPGSYTAARAGEGGPRLTKRVSAIGSFFTRGFFNKMDPGMLAGRG